MKTNIKKILIIISIIIFIIGILSIFEITSTLNNSISNTENLYVDGSNFTPIVQTFGYLGIISLTIVIMFYDVIIILVIWGVYGISLLISKIIKKLKNKSK